MIATLINDLLIILAAGLAAGIICKRIGLSMIVGYLVAGAVIGHGGLGLVAEGAAENGADIEHLAEAGVLLLLFAIGIEFSLEELVRLGRHILVGGSMQMLLVAVPVGLACSMFLSWQASLLIATATALSSTVLVYRALTEWGATATPHGRRAIGILLFQDAALVPLIMLVPLLTGQEVGDGLGHGKMAYVQLALNSTLFVAAVPILRSVCSRWVAPVLSHLRSVELVILFSLIVLVGACLGAEAAGLPAALGAFAGGLVLNGNRLTGQIDAVILPYRESFGAVFFVSLGTMIDVQVLLKSPVLMISAMVGLIALKTAAATLALRLTKLPWRVAFGAGMGLAQMGELSFVLLSEGMHADLISESAYNRMLLVAMVTLIATPQLLKSGLGLTRRLADDDTRPRDDRRSLGPPPKEAIVVGLGPMGRLAASQLETAGVDVCLIDLSAVNLHAHAQQGFRTISGDASDEEVLDRADAADVRLAVICVPDDRSALQIVKSLRRFNGSCAIMVRCRYQSNRAGLRKAGAHTVISEEAEASSAMLRLLQGMDTT